MGLGQIRNMDIIPDAGAVRRIIVCSENGDVVPLPQRNLEDQRNQMGFRIMRFSDLSVWMGSAGIEIPQRNVAEIVSLAGPVEHFLHGKFRFSVGIRRSRPVGLQNRNPLRLPVGRRRGGEHDLVHPVGHHTLQQRLRAAEIIIVILQRPGHTLSHLGESREVDHPVDVLPVENRINEGSVPDIPPVEFRLRMNRFPESGEEVVRHHHIFSLVD